MATWQPRNGQTRAHTPHHLAYLTIPSNPYEEGELHEWVKPSWMKRGEGMQGIVGILVTRSLMID